MHGVVRNLRKAVFLLFDVTHDPNIDKLVLEDHDLARAVKLIEDFDEKLTPILMRLSRIVW